MTESFLWYSLAFTSFLLAADIGMHVIRNRDFELPLSPKVQMAFFFVTFPAAMSWLWLTIYGIYRLGFLYAISGLIIAIVATVFIRPIFAGRKDLYMVAMILSIAGFVVVFSIPPKQEPWKAYTKQSSYPTFGGYQCATSTCSGHKAGYSWAMRQGIADTDDCTGKSRSFIEGCQAYVEQ